MTDVEEHLRRRFASHGDGGPLVIIIAGGSASGKGTVARALTDDLEPFATRSVNMDRYFKPTDQLPTYYSPRINGPHPDWNQPDSFRYRELIAALRSWARDGAGGEDVLILEGILALHFAELRELAHLGLFIHTDADERIVRRLRRNMPERGMTFDEVADYYIESVRDRHLQFVQPTRAFADLVIPGGSRPTEAGERQRTLQAVVRACARVVEGTRS